MKVGLLFGSFNPIHIGHIAIAKYMAENTDLGQVWLVVSPHNPLKEKKSLADAKKRLTQVRKSIGRNPKIKVSDIEFGLPQPSYTIHTLEFLNKKYSKKKFTLIIGLDNLISFHKWKDYKKILKKFEVYVYPRKTSFNKNILSRLWKYPNVTFFNAPLIDVSSTFIREQMMRRKNVKKLLG
ncbi:MAG: nicotinate-nucleotide adenylyltransferase [Bacteroidetes bacterium]|nr:nicotinate-nucleotide adenylyltransferase [Bacteroidota bacterium]